jgi:hypothetical protein
VSRDQPQHSRRSQLIAACVAGGNIGFQLIWKWRGALQLEPAGKDARTDLLRQDFALNI